jgi:putative ABC transport system permease protein
METLLQDLRYGVRKLLARPAITVMSVATLALCIGANTAIFTVVDAVVLQPLPFSSPERLVAVRGDDAKQSDPEQPVSYDDFRDFADQSRSFSALAAYTSPWSFNLTGAGEPEQIRALYVSHAFFPALEATPILGRAILDADDVPNAAPVAVISRGLWTRRFGANPEILGKTITLNDQPFTVVGVAGPELTLLEEADVWIPLSLNPILDRGRGVRFLELVGRLAPDASLERARAEISTIAAALAEQSPDTNATVGVRLAPLHEEVTGSVRPALVALFGAVSFLLLLACANVANLMLARAISSRREIVVRVALGASRLRIARQTLVESLVLAASGGAIGLLLAMWGVDALLALAPEDLPRAASIHLDKRVFAFTAVVSMATGILFGLVPALRSSEIALNESLKEGGRSATPGPSRRMTSNALMASQVALALVLLVGAGLLATSFVHLLAVDPGFRTENVLTFQLLLSGQSYAEREPRAAFDAALQERLSALPGVDAVGTITRLPLRASDRNITSTLTIEGTTTPLGERPEVDFRRASSRYFEALGIPLVEGRRLTPDDAASERGVVVNETLARRFFPGESAIGRRVALGPSPEEGPWYTIVGVVGDVRHLSLDTLPRPEIYLHAATSPASSPIVVLHTDGDAAALAGAVRGVVRELDPNLPVSALSTMDDYVARSVAEQRFALLLFAIFATIALALAAVGIYGVVSYSVGQRTHEIGIRMALGARGRDVLGMVLGQGLLVSAIGVAAGALGALLLARSLATLLYEVDPLDPLVYVGVAAGLLAVSALVSLVPARRATRVDPVVALRSE